MNTSSSPNSNSPSHTESLNLCLCADANYYEGLETALTSAIISSKDSTKHFNCYIIDSGLESAQRKQLDSLLRAIAKRYTLTINLHWLQIDQATIQSLKQLEGSYTYFIGLLLPDLIPHESWVVCIDSDIFCLKDFTPAYSLDEDTPIYAAIDSEIPTLKFEAPDPSTLNEKNLDLDTPYINAGVIYYNLDLWRREKLTETLLQWAVRNKEHLILHDQSITNWNLAHRAKHLPREYNVLFRAAELVHNVSNSPINFHFAGSCKPWLLNFKVDLKHAPITYCQIVMTQHYLNFRSTELNDHRADRLEKIALEAENLLRFLDKRFSYQRCLFKMLFYKVTGSKPRYAIWNTNSIFFKQHRDTAIKTLSAIAQGISSGKTKNISS